MTQVEIRLGAVVGDVDLAVLVRAHRPGIDVDVGVELLQRHGVAVVFEESADGGGRQPLAEGRDDATGNEDVFDWPTVCSLGHAASFAGADRLGIELPARTLQILGRIDAEGLVNGFRGADTESVLERPQLLE